MASLLVTSSESAAFGGKAELVDEVDDAGAAGELDDVGHALDRFEAAASFRRLDEPGDVLVDDLLTLLHRYRLDELLASQDRGDLVVAEHPLASWQAKARACHHDRLVDRRLDGHATEDLVALGEELGEETAERLVLADIAACHRDDRWRHATDGR